MAEVGRHHAAPASPGSRRRHGWPEPTRRSSRALIAWTLVLVGQRDRTRSGARAIGAQRSSAPPVPKLPDRAVVNPLEFALLMRLMARAFPTGARVLGIFQAAAESIREDQVRPVPQWAGPTAVADATGRLELQQALAAGPHPRVELPDVEAIAEVESSRAARAHVSISEPRSVCLRATIVCLRDGTRVVCARRPATRARREEP